MNDSSLSTGTRKQKLLFKCISRDQWPLVIAGDSDELGKWKLDDALRAVPRNLPQGGIEWTAQVELPLGQTIEYKFVKHADGGPRWESGNNHRITVIPGLHAIDADFRD